MRREYSGKLFFFILVIVWGAASGLHLFFNTRNSVYFKLCFLRTLYYGLFYIPAIPCMFLSHLLMWDNPIFETVSKEFETREHALNWIIENQLGRRNLNPNQIAYLRGKRYETEKKIQGAPTGNKNAEKQTSTNRKFENHRTENQPLTREIVAKEYGVSGSTIQQKSINLYVSVGQ